MSSKLSPAHFIAHRGYQKAFPENTLLSIEAAISAGAQHVELDILFSADQQPVLYHDLYMQRISHQNSRIDQLSKAQLQTISAYEPERLGDQFIGNTINGLDELWPVITINTHVQFYIEIKCEALQTLSAEQIHQQLLKQLDIHTSNITLIGYDEPLLQYLRQQGWPNIGLVLTTWQQIHNQSVANLHPNIVFCNYTKTPSEGSLRPPFGQLALYEITSIDLAQHYMDRGADLIETFEIVEMMEAAR